MKLLLLLLVKLLAIQAFVVENAIDSNDSSANKTNYDVFCRGKILHTVQMSSINVDSKTFVDMKMKQTPGETLDLFEQFMTEHNQNPSKDDIRAWVDKHFDKPGSEFENWNPDDWIESPKFLEKIKDANYKKFASDMNGLWHVLGRKMTPDVAKNPNLYSIIPVEYPVIVPGGRFREFYYWDSFWIVKGLLLSEMHNTTKGMLENFLSIINRYGFIPNGGRIYYLSRSQPPLFAGMVKIYYEATNDEEFAKKSVETLDREFQYWVNNHSVEVKGHTLFHYNDRSKGPRPESHREDYELAIDFGTEDEKNEFYSDIKSAAEAGMDFTSKWFINKDGENKGNLSDVKTRNIIPVELNAILYWNAKIIAEFYGLTGNTKKQEEFLTKANEIYEAVQTVLWREDVGAWLDYDTLNNKHREYFCATNLSPLWVDCFDKSNKNLADKILAYIDKVGIDKYPGGVPHTFEPTGQQWDFPNVWPPLQDILIKGLQRLGNKKADDLAMDWIQRWVRSNWITYNTTFAMYEKYHAEKFGEYGGGGEYEIQIGFGWTNGIIMDYCNLYGDVLTSDTK